MCFDMYHDKILIKTNWKLILNWYSAYIYIKDFYIEYG